MKVTSKTGTSGNPWGGGAGAKQISIAPPLLTLITNCVILPLKMVSTIISKIIFICSIGAKTNTQTNKIDMHRVGLERTQNRGSHVSYLLQNYLLNMYFILIAYNLT